MFAVADGGPERGRRRSRYVPVEAGGGVIRLGMQDRFDEALRVAAELDPEAQLVRIIGIGLHRDGRVQLGAVGDYTSRWEYAFRNDLDGHRPPVCITVLYWQDGQRHVDPRAGNVGRELAYFDEELIPGLLDSPVLAERFQAVPDHEPLGGSSDDLIVYTMRRPLDPVAAVHNFAGQHMLLDPLRAETAG